MDELLDFNLKPLAATVTKGKVTYKAGAGATVPPQPSGSGGTPGSTGSASGSVGSAPGSAGSTQSPAQPGTDFQSNQKHFAGKDRFETSELIALEHFPASDKKHVMVADGYAPADALTGAPLAYKEGAPIILASKSFVDSKVLNNY